MRSGVHGLPIAHPIGERLPAVYAEDDFAQRMTSALDDVLAPVFATLDCLPDYFDPILAPPDFVEWLSEWVAFSLDEGWTLAQRRALVADAVELHRLRGTARGLEKHVRLLTLGDVEIVDTGACTVSARPRPSVPSPEPHVEVRVAVADPATGRRAPAAGRDRRGGARARHSVTHDHGCGPGTERIRTCVGTCAGSVGASQRIRARSDAGAAARRVGHPAATAARPTCIGFRVGSGTRTAGIRAPGIGTAGVRGFGGRWPPTNGCASPNRARPGTRHRAAAGPHRTRRSRYAAARRTTVIVYSRRSARGTQATTALAVYRRFPSGCRPATVRRSASRNRHRRPEWRGG